MTNSSRHYDKLRHWDSSGPSNFLPLSASRRVVMDPCNQYGEMFAATESHNPTRLGLDESTLCDDEKPEEKLT
jgi:hypothetical protein